MDADRFDGLVKSLATGTSRRRVLTGLLGLGLGGGALLGGEAPTAAIICRNPGDLCAKDAQCCSGSCVANHCACPSGQSFCDGQCIDTQSNTANCGACGHVCPAGQACCAGGCTDEGSDSNNCGSCGNVCSNCGTCSAGCCESTSCGCCPSVTGTQCYWLDCFNFDGNCCWVPYASVDQGECQYLDSCSPGGGGGSGDGCYKWADSSC